MKKIWAIPDIHGRLDLLLQILARLEKEEVDRIIFLGDMIDRGPQSAEVVTLIKIHCEGHPTKYTALYGNHEDLMVEAFNPQGKPHAHDLWHVNGGNKTRKSYGPQKDILASHIEWIKTLPLFIEEEGFFFSHAPIPHNALKPYHKNQLIWSYPGGLAYERGYAKKLENATGVCGHVHALGDNVFEPRFYDHYIYADAGCGCHPKAPLVAIEVNSRKVIEALPI